MNDKFLQKYIALFLTEASVGQYANLTVFRFISQDILIYS